MTRRRVHWAAVAFARRFGNELRYHAEVLSALGGAAIVGAVFTVAWVVWQML